MSKIVMNIGPGGRIRAIHDDNYPFMEAHGCKPPMRASHVEPIQHGPSAGQWYVDMSPLGEDFQYCLWPPFPRRDVALAAEHEHVKEKWVLGRQEEKTEPQEASQDLR